MAYLDEIINIILSYLILDFYIDKIIFHNTGGEIRVGKPMKKFLSWVFYVLTSYFRKILLNRG